MRLPRDLSGDGLAKVLATLGYEVTRQTGSHMRLTTQEQGGHHVTVPQREALRIGTVAAVLADIADHFGLSKESLVERLFGR